MISDLKRITNESAFLHPILNSLPSNAVESGVVSSGVLRTSFGDLKQLGMSDFYGYLDFAELQRVPGKGENSHNMINMEVNSKIIPFSGEKIPWNFQVFGTNFSLGSLKKNWLT